MGEVKFLKGEPIAFAAHHAEAAANPGEQLQQAFFRRLNAINPKDLFHRADVIRQELRNLICRGLALLHHHGGEALNFNGP